MSGPTREKYHLPLKRLWRIVSVARKYGLGELLNGLQLSGKGRTAINLLLGSKPHSASRGERIRLALQELGPVFVKFGQALSTRPDILPPDIAAELTKLQDQVPPFAGQEAMAIVKASLDQPFDSVFREFDETPLASASVAQVHACTLADGTEAITKVVRPGILSIIEQDLAVLYKLAQLARDHWEQGPRLRPVEVVQEYDKTIHGELDMRTEAANAAQMKNNFTDSDLIYVPNIYWDYTSESVLVMERIYGTSIREVETLRAKGIDMRKLSHDGVEIFFKQAFEDNFFHADMHPGNIFVADNGQYRAVDFGIMGTLTDEDKNYLAENFIAFFNRDYRQVAEAHLRAGWVPAETRVEEFEAAIRTVCEPIFAKKISEISFGKFLLQLFQTARKFDMPIQPQLVLLQKTLLNIEGLGRQLYPDLDLWDTAKPFLERWMSQQIGPKAFVQAVRKELPNWQKTLPALPRLLSESVEWQHQIQSKLDQQNREIAGLRKQLAQREQRRWNRWAGIIVAICGLILAHWSQRSDQPIAYWEIISTAMISGGLLWALLKSVIKPAKD